MPAAYSIKCPTCGSAFLATQTRPTSITTCPHCAYNAPLQAFQAEGIIPLGPATALPVRRRDPRTHYQQTPPPPAAPEPPPTLPAPPPPATPPLTPAASPQAPVFPEIPTFTPSPLLAAPLAEPPAPHPQPLPQLETLFEHAPFPPLTPARPPQPPPDTFLPQAEFATLIQSAQKPPNPPIWLTRLGILSFLIVATGAAWLMWQARSVESQSIETSLPETPDPTLPTLDLPSNEPQAEPPPNPTLPAVSVPHAPPPPAVNRVDLEALSERVLTEGSELFRQILATPDDPSLQIDQYKKYRPQCQAFFTRHGRITAQTFQKVPVAPRDLQTGLPVQMLQVTTSASPESGALLRFHLAPDNRLLLDWPLFEETHDGALAQFVESPTETGSRWFSVGLRRNHGLDLDASARDLHHAFDLQAASKSLLGIPAIVVRDLPVGRYLDQKTEWRIVHMARLLLRPRTLDSGLRCVEIIDCEGLGLAQSRPAPPPASKPPVGTMPEPTIPPPSQ